MQETMREQTDLIKASVVQNLPHFYTAMHTRQCLYVQCLERVQKLTGCYVDNADKQTDKQTERQADGLERSTHADQHSLFLMNE